MPFSHRNIAARNAAAGSALPEKALKKKGSVLITGATGILGGWLVAEALDRGYKTTVLVRAKSIEGAKQRLHANLGVPGSAERVGELNILLGDISKPDFGLAPGARDALIDSIDFVIHSAACISFHPRQDALLRATNIDAVERIIGLLAGTGKPLHHVSTAYVSGMHHGRVRESDIFDSPVKNTYEETKRAAEQLIHEAMDDGRITGSIFRPSCVIGATTTGGISQFQNFYHILRIVDALERDENVKGRHIRLQGNPSSTANLIPVDWTAKALWFIVETKGASGLTYHLTNPNPITKQEFSDWACGRLKRNGGGKLTYVNRLDNKINNAELVANLSVMLYREYLRDEAAFDSTNTEQAFAHIMPCPRIDAGFLDILLKKAREEDWNGVYGARLRELKLASAPSPRFNIDALRHDLAQDNSVQCEAV